MNLPIKPESSEKLKDRFKDAIAEAVEDMKDFNPGADGRHVFDHIEGVRYLISRSRKEGIKVIAQVQAGGPIHGRIAYSGSDWLDLKIDQHLREIGGTHLSAGRLVASYPMFGDLHRLYKYERPAVASESPSNALAQEPVPRRRKLSVADDALGRSTKTVLDGLIEIELKGGRGTGVELPELKVTPEFTKQHLDFFAEMLGSPIKPHKMEIMMHKSEESAKEQVLRDLVERGLVMETNGTYYLTDDGRQTAVVFE